MPPEKIKVQLKTKPKIKIKPKLKLKIKLQLVSPAIPCEVLQTKTRIHLLPIIKNIYDDIKNLYQPLIEHIKKAFLLRCRGQNPFTWYDEFGTKNHKLNLENLGDLFIATTVARIARISLNISFANCKEKFTPVRFSTQAPKASSSSTSQLQVVTGKTSSKYPRVAEKLNQETSIPTSRHAEITRKVQEDTDTDGNYGLMAAAGEIWDTLLGRKVDTELTPAQISILNIWGAAETYRDPAMLVFFIMALDNIERDEINLDEAVGGGRKAYPPSSVGAQALLNMLFMQQNGADVCKVLKQEDQGKMRSLKNQMRSQIAFFLNVRTAAIPAEKPPETAAATKSLEKPREKFFAASSEVSSGTGVVSSAGAPTKTISGGDVSKNLTFFVEETDKIRLFGTSKSELSPEDMQKCAYAIVKEQTVDKIQTTLKIDPNTTPEQFCKRLTTIGFSL